MKWNKISEGEYPEEGQEVLLSLSGLHPLPYSYHYYDGSLVKGWIQTVMPKSKVLPEREENQWIYLSDITPPEGEE
jgi:hypothetical protein